MYDGFHIYKAPPISKAKIVVTQGRDKQIQSLEQALIDIATKARIQTKIIEAYEKDVKAYLKWRAKALDYPTGKE